MPKKKGDISIPSEQRLKWLRRYEDGDSIFKIATDTGYDHRTVKKHIELAKMEKELKDERSIVLRNALEHHFSDLLNIVEIVITRVNADRAVEFTGDEKFLSDALLRHIPRSPIWPLLRRWNSCIEEIAQLTDKMRSSLDLTLAGDTELKAVNASTDGQLFRVMDALLMFNAVERSRGRPGLDVKNLKKERRSSGLWAVSCGFAEFSDLGDNDLKALESALTRIESDLQASKEFDELKDNYRRLADTQAKLKEELRVIKWKRIVPGRCRLCPI